MKVSDVMQRKVDFVTPETSILGASQLIFGHHHNGLPVVEKKTRKIVGFITDQDIISQLYPSVSEFMEDYVHEHNFEDMEKKVMSVMKMPVSKVMSKRVISVKEDTPLLQAESIMKIRDVSRLPVLDAEKNLVGILSKGDVFRALVGNKIVARIKKPK